MDRRFSEQEVAEIIRRATEDQLASRRAEPTPEGVSETELRRIAGELGILPDSLERALGQVGTVSSNETGTMLSLERTLERTVSGEVDEEGYSTVVDHFTPATGAQFGGTVRIGRMVSFNSMIGLAQCQVSIVSREGRTSLKVKSNAFLAIFAAFVPAFLAMMVGTAAIAQSHALSDAAKMGLTAALAVVLFGGATYGMIAMFMRTNRKVKAKVEATVQGLCQAAQPLRDRLAPSLAEEEAADVEQARL